MEVENIPLRHLKTWPGHARKGTPVVDDLVASIKAEGLLQPLVVVKDHNGEGGYFVIAGNRRLEALRKLADPTVGALPPIACNVLPDGIDDDKLLEISLAENAVRLDMHPMDECEAFAKLAGEGKDLPGIARAFDVSERFVRQRLVLATLPEKARTAYRKGEIGYDGAVALARLGDPKLVAKAMKIGKGWNGNYEHAAGQLMRDEKRFYVEHARFPTAVNYKTAEDLFDVDDKGQPAGPYFIKYREAMTEQSAWLSQRMLALAKNDSYAFVDLRPEQGFYTAFRRAEAEETKGVGIVCWIEPSGEVREERAVSLKSERQQEVKKAKEAKKADVAKKAAKGEKVHAGEVSNAFAYDLRYLHLVALMRYMAAHPEVFAERVETLCAFNTDHGSALHDDVRKLLHGAIKELLDEGTLAAKVASHIVSDRGANAYKALAKELDLGAIEWPKMMLARLPRVMLDAEAKALKLQVRGEKSKTALIDLIWKHRPKGWVPQYARL